VENDLPSRVINWQGTSCYVTRKIIRADINFKSTDR
jgi:hypothetical protein